MKTLDTLLHGINLADYEGAKDLVVSIKDLRLLRKTILNQQVAIRNTDKQMDKLNKTMKTKLLEPIYPRYQKLDTYC